MIASRSDLFSPKKFRSFRIHKNPPIGVTVKRIKLYQGFSGVIATSYGVLTWRRIETGRRFITRQHRRGKVWRKVNLTQPVTAKSSKSRIGKGKGKFKAWIGYIRPNTLMYEAELPIDSIFYTSKKKSIRASHRLPLEKIKQKFPFKTKILSNKFYYKELYKWKKSAFYINSKIDSRTEKSVFEAANLYSNNLFLFFWITYRCFSKWLKKNKIIFAEAVEFSKFGGRTDWRNDAYNYFYSSSFVSNLEFFFIGFFGYFIRRKVVTRKIIKKIVDKKKKIKKIFKEKSIKKLIRKKIKNQKIKYSIFSKIFSVKKKKT